jgi:hypothetical protein
MLYITNFISRYYAPPVRNEFEALPDLPNTLFPPELLSLYFPPRQDSLTELHFGLSVRQIKFEDKKYEKKKIKIVFLI